MSLLRHDVRRRACAVASHFRNDFFDCLPVRGDALFEPTDTLLCAEPAWLSWSGTSATLDDVDRCRQSFLRRIDLEHAF